MIKVAEYWINPSRITYMKNGSMGGEYDSPSKPGVYIHFGKTENCYDYIGIEGITAEEIVEQLKKEPKQCDEKYDEKRKIEQEIDALKDEKKRLEEKIALRPLWKKVFFKG